jgi:hypothetical protein
MDKKRSRLTVIIDSEKNTNQRDQRRSLPNIDFEKVAEAYSIITPSIILGSDHIPNSTNALKLLKNLGITHVLSMAEENVFSVEIASSDLILKRIPIRDSAEQALDDALREAISFISISF